MKIVLLNWATSKSLRAIGHYCIILVYPFPSLYVYTFFRPDPGGGSTSAIGLPRSSYIASCILQDAGFVQPMGQE